MTDELLSSALQRWEAGYAVGYAAGIRAAHHAGGYNPEPMRFKPEKSTKRKSKKGKDPTPTLTKMTAPIWKRYKAGSGKKTYFDIRNQVRRSVKYKRAKKTRGA